MTPLELVATTKRRNRPNTKIDWPKAFIEWLSLGPGNRNQSRFAEHIGCLRGTFLRRMKAEGWNAKTAAFDAAALEKAEANAVRAMADRHNDELRVVDALTRKFAMRLRDPNYQPSAQEWAAGVRVQLLIEGGGAASKLDADVKVGVTDELREKIARLPVYAQERLLLTAMTGASLEEIIEAEVILDEEERLAEVEGR